MILSRLTTATANPTAFQSFKTLSNCGSNSAIRLSLVLVSCEKVVAERVTASKNKKFLIILLLIFFVPGTLYKPSGLCTGMRSIFYYLHAIYKNMDNSLGILMWFCKCCFVPNFSGIKNYNIRIVSNFEFSPFMQFHICCGQL